MKARWIAAIAAGAVVIAGCNNASREKPAPVADTGAQPTTARDPQASYEPRSQPGAGQQYLKRMAGQWGVVKTFYPRGGGAPAVSRGTCTQTMVQEGRFLESEFVFEDANGRTTGTGVIGFDAQTGTFTSFWFDSRSTRFSVRQSDGAFDGEQIAMVSQTIGAPDPGAGGARRSRTVSRLEDHDRRLIHRQFTTGPGGQERLVMQLEMTRAGEAPSPPGVTGTPRRNAPGSTEGR